MQSAEAFSDLHRACVEHPAFVLWVLVFQRGFTREQALRVLRLVQYSDGDYKWYERIRGLRVTTI
jgi:hypothetical protein